MSSFHLTKSKIFLLFCLSFFAGVFAASFVFPPAAGAPVFVKAILFLCFAALLALAAVFWNKKTAVVFFFCLISAVFGVYRFAGFGAVQKETAVADFNNLKAAVAIKGIIAKNPAVKSGNVQYEIAAEKIKAGGDSGKEMAVSGKILITAKNFPLYGYGDRLEIKGKLVSPKNFSGDFDYVSYLAKDQIRSLVYYPEIGVIGENRGNVFYRAVYSVKNKFEENLGKILSEPHASFLAGLLLGSRGSIPDDLKEKFKQTGTSHILAISGYNISVLAVFLASILSFFYLSPGIIFYLSVSAIFVFVILTGAEPSVIRAAIMGGLVLLSRKEGRVYSMANAIVSAGAAMLFADPLILRYDVGFQLSFLATLGLVLVLPRLENYFRNLPAALGLKEAFLATASAQAAVLPLLLYNFGNLSFVSLAVNVLILPAVPFAMFSGFLAGALSFVALPLGKIAGFFAWIFLSYEIKIVEIFSAIPFGFVKISNFPAFLVILYYAGLVYFLFIREKINREEI